MMNVPIISFPQLLQIAKYLANALAFTGWFLPTLLPMSGSVSGVLTKFQTAYARITISRLGVLFILLSCVHCLAQGAIQVALLRSDAGQKDILYQVMRIANVSSAEIPWLRHFGHDDFELDVCAQFPLPGINTTAMCKMLLRTSDNQGTTSPQNELKLNGTLLYSPANVARRSLNVASITPLLNMSGHIDGVQLSYDRGAKNVVLNETCARSLALGHGIIASIYYEDAVLLATQFWLMIISIVAVVYRSVPQILASVSARILATGWAIYALWRITAFAPTFQLLYAFRGTPCQFDFFSDYWTRRIVLAIPSLILNITALGFEGLLGRRLIKTFTLYMFQRAVPPVPVLRVYRYFLVVFVLLQFDVFFLASGVGLWAVFLLRGIHKSTIYDTLSEALSFTTIITLFPWLAMGWHAVRREMRKTFAAWLIMGFVYLMSWTLMFSSSSFRWTFLYWEFFACLTCTTYVALIATGIAGIICRVNFDKGLAHYLHVEEALTKSGFAVGLFSDETEQPRPPKTSAATGITAEKHYGKSGQSDVGTGIQGSSAM